jgi:hypothetical protein
MKCFLTDCVTTIPVLDGAGPTKLNYYWRRDTNLSIWDGGGIDTIVERQSDISGLS